MTSDRITVEQMAILESGVVETTCATVVTDAIQEQVRAIIHEA